MSGWLGYFNRILIFTLLMTAGAAFWTLFSVIQETRSDRGAPRENVYGVATQFEYELLTLIDTLSRFEEGEESVTKDAVIERFDVLWSRLDTISSGRLAQTYMALAGVEESVARVKRVLARIEPDVMSLERGDSKGVRKVRDALRSLTGSVHSVTMTVNSDSALKTAATHQRREELGERLIVFLVGVFLAASISIAVLWFERRQLDDLSKTLEKRVAERMTELGIQSARLTAILENAPIHIVIKDLQGRITAISRNTAELFGTDPVAAIGARSEDFMPAHSAEKYLKADKKVLETGEPFQQEIRDQVDGEVKHYLSSKFPLRDEENRVIGICSLASDITEMKTADERLRQAQKMEAIGQLTGGVAHDFNNLLAVIQGNAELLSEACPAQTPLTGAILRATGRGAELTRQLLAYSRKQPLQPQKVDFGELLGAIHGMLSRTLGETISVRIESKPDLWPTLADPGQVENAILNLALNARDAMPRGGQLMIRAANVHQSECSGAVTPELAMGEYIALSVGDTGVGMAAGVLEHAFEPFYTTKEVGAGSGLGLSMVYGFAKQSGGHASIHSEVGKGTTVVLYLPRANESVAAKPVEANGDIPRGNGETVLVIEDDEDVRAVAVSMLDELGYRAIEVSEASGARAALARQKIDLILSDVILPGGTSGPEFVAEAKEISADIKVVLMSGYTAEAARPAGMLNPDAGLLNKPFLRRQLAVTLRDALAGFAPGRGSPDRPGALPDRSGRAVPEA